MERVPYHVHRNLFLMVSSVILETPDSRWLGVVCWVGGMQVQATNSLEDIWVGNDSLVPLYPRLNRLI